MKKEIRAELKVIRASCPGLRRRSARFHCAHANVEVGISHWRTCEAVGSPPPTRHHSFVALWWQVTRTDISYTLILQSRRSCACVAETSGVLLLRVHGCRSEWKSYCKDKDFRLRGNNTLIFSSNDDANCVARLHILQSDPEPVWVVLCWKWHSHKNSLCWSHGTGLVRTAERKLGQSTLECLDNHCFWLFYLDQRFTEREETKNHKTIQGTVFSKHQSRYKQLHTQQMTETKGS